MTILLLRLSLKLILIPLHNRRRAPNPLQLTLNIIVQMLVAITVLRERRATIPPTDRSAAILVVEDGRSCWGCVAGDRGVEVTSVADGPVRG
jgi:hypothetical protein